MLAGPSGVSRTYGYVKLKGAGNLKAHVCIDLSPKPLSAKAGDWVEGPLDEIAEGYRTFMRDAKGQREFVTWYADKVMVERDLKPEEMAWIVDQSLTTPHWTAAALFASGMFANNLAEAKLLDEKMPDAQCDRQTLGGNRNRLRQKGDAEFGNPGDGRSHDVLGACRRVQRGAWPNSSNRRSRPD